MLVACLELVICDLGFHAGGSGTRNPQPVIGRDFQHDGQAVARKVTGLAKTLVTTAGKPELNPKRALVPPAAAHRRKKQRSQ
jgi:hypothetical protein